MRAPAVVGVVALASAIATASVAGLHAPEASGSVAASAPSFRTGRILVRLRPSVAHEAYSQARERRSMRPDALAALSRRLAGARLEPEFPGERPGGNPDLTTFWIAHVDTRLPLASALELAAASPEVEEVSPIAVIPLDPIVGTDAGLVPAGDGSVIERAMNLAVPAPNDSLWSLCYWLYQSSRRDLHALEAWEITRGDPNQVIAIIDTGILRWHPDLGGTTASDFGQLWTNEIERAGAPGVDDDADGYVDDLWGWDFVALDSAAMVRAGEDWRDEDNDPTDFAVHGTAVAGVAAALAGNVSGIAGVAHGAKLMALRAGYSTTYNPAGEVDMSWVARAIRYAVRHGATVINCSFSSFMQFDLTAAVESAIEAGVLIVVAAGNNGSINIIGRFEETISVTASDAQDRITSFANRAGWVDLAAPGQSIATTTLRQTGTDSVSLRTPFYSRAEAGTSLSAPMMAGAAALMQSERRARGLAPYGPLPALLRLSETCDDISALNPGDGFGAGRLNLHRLLTDPPRSTASRAGVATIGPAALVTAPGVGTIAVYAAADSSLVYLQAATGDTLTRTLLGARPAGGVASAPLGPALGPGCFVALEDGRLAGFDLGGNPLPGWPVQATPTTGDQAMPALGDLDGDDLPEIVWGGNDGKVWAWRASGEPLPGFPYSTGASGPNVRVALGPLNACVGLEVVAGNGSLVHAIDGSGQRVPGWPVLCGDGQLPPVIARFHLDSTPTIVVANGRVIRALSPNGSVLYSRYLDFGVAVGELAAGDLDDDGLDEIVGLTSDQDYLYVFDTHGNLPFSRPLTSRSGPPLIGPMGPGPGAQVVVCSEDAEDRPRVLAFAGTLLPIPGWPRIGHTSHHPSLADLDGDGATEVSAGTGSEGWIVVYDAGPGSWRPEAAFWTTPRGDFARTGSRVRPPPASGLPATTPIRDLRLQEVGTRSATVRWSAPTTSGPGGRAIGYDVRLASHPIDSLNFADAPRVTQFLVPAPPAAPESLPVASLEEGGSYWIAIRARDGCGRWGPVSNVLGFSTRSLGPNPVSDLHVVAGADSALTLAWTATGEDGSQGRPRVYRVRATEGPIDSAAFATAVLGIDHVAVVPAGLTERVTLSRLPRGRRVYIALRAKDANGNESALSNAVASLVGRLATRDGVALVPRSPSRAPLELDWQGDPRGGDAGQSISIYDTSGRLMASIELGVAPGGVARWDGRGRGGEAPAGIYFARLASGPSRAHARLVLLR